MLKLALAEELALPPPRPISNRSIIRLGILVRPSDHPVTPQTEEEAEAWITHLRLVRRRENISKLRLGEGDIVETKAGDMAEVSSIGQDGRVYFRGGRGFGAWPDLITSVVARRGESSESAQKARREAANLAARRQDARMWSLAKSQELSEFITENAVSEEDVEELEAVIASADDERPIQQFLQENKHLLTALLGGVERYCIPQKRLGAEYVPDFVIGDVNSLGFRWVLVELETPKSGIYLKDGLQFDESTRSGLSQILHWREWLSTHIAYARSGKSENGLRLFDIREQSDAIVIVGRRSRIPKTTDALRHQHRQSGIHVHSYDWLLETLLGAIRHQGPPASNPYLIQNMAVVGEW